MTKKIKVQKSFGVNYLLGHLMTYKVITDYDIEITFLKWHSLK